MILIIRIYFDNCGVILFFILVRMLIIVLNEIVMITIIMTHNFGEDGALGLVVNFSAVIIICEFDDIVMKSGRI